MGLDKDERVSRRDFFRKATGRILPILGGIALMGVPSSLRAASEPAPDYCPGSCTGLCTTSCTGSCKGECRGSCTGDCAGGCQTSCTTTCKQRQMRFDVSK